MTSPPADRDTQQRGCLSRVPAAGLFLPRPVTAPDSDGVGYVVVRTYRAAIFPGGLALVVLPGFRFDGCSIPRPLWAILGHPMLPRYQASALIHDAAYAAELLPRAVCDAVFRLCLIMDGTSRWRAWRMWLGVRIGGGVVWARHTPDSVCSARLYCRLKMGVNVA